MANVNTNGNVLPAELDAVVVGAGFGGMYMLNKLRDLGMTTTVFEAAPDVGGTWYWNAYPGARCDIESLMYNYSFDSELRDEYKYKWPERYSRQPDILKYAQHVADRFDLRSGIRFNTRVTSSKWDERTHRWSIETDQGEHVSARFLISAVGCLSASQMPAVPGLESFKGDWYHTGQWPHERVDFSGKRVIQIGTGSSGIQAAPVIASEAGHLTLLQRTPQFSIPSQNSPLTPEVVDESSERFAQMVAMMKQATGRPLWEAFATKNTFDDTPEEREAYLEQMWQMGGAGFPMAYKDSMTNPKANDELAEFVRRKIRSIVSDPETAAKLMPTYPIGTKRQVIDTGYFDTFNRPNVTLEDIKADPIARVLPNGIELQSGKVIEGDIIVFATGFDAMTGSIIRLNIEGVGGKTLAESWQAGPKTHLGIATHEFPNLFLLTGPGSPSVLSNVISSLEQHVDWLVKLLDHLRQNEITRIEADPEHQERWTAHCNDLAYQTLWPQADSWYMGANIPGKPRVFMPYIGGNAMYQVALDDSAAKGYEGFHLEKSRVAEPV